MADGISDGNAGVDGAPPALESSDDDLAEGGEERVLVVEDEPGVRAFVEQALKVSGYQVEAFANGADALRRIESGAPFDVILSDVVMPQMSGLELVDRARERQPGIAVVLMSGYPQRAEKDLSIHEDVRLLAKPFTSDELRKALRRVIDARPRSQPKPASRPNHDEPR